MKSINRKVITYGTFDVFHYGHFFLLERAKLLGCHLTVAVSSDAFNLKKGKKSKLTCEERVRILESIEFIDKVILEETWDQKVEDIKKYNVDIFVIGDDWSGHFDFLSEYCEVLYLPRTQGISSSLIKNSL